MKYLISILLLLCLNVCWAQANNDHPIWEKVKALNTAVFETKDSASIHQLTSSRLSYGHSGGNIESKEIMLRNAVANKEEYKNICFEAIETIVLKKTVVIRHSLQADAYKNGASSVLSLAILQVWTKEKGDWKLVARQAVRTTPK